MAWIGDVDGGRCDVSDDPDFSAVNLFHDRFLVHFVQVGLEGRVLQKIAVLKIM